MRRKVKKIALDLSNTYFIENYRIRAYYGVIRYAREHTSWKLMYNVESFSLSSKFTNYEDLPKLGADGIIFLSENPDVLERILATGLPAVSITNLPSRYPIPQVLSDDTAVGKMAAEHMLERGFRHFAFAGSSHFLWAVDREAGFRKTVEAAGCTFEAFNYEQGSTFDPARDHATARRLRDFISRQPRPLAVLGENDTKALHVLEACQTLKLEVPNEIAIVGVDNNAMICDAVLPSLSSVEQNTDRVGYEAAAMLDRILSNEAIGSQPIIIPPKRVAMRMSTDVLAVDDQAVARALLFIRDHLTEPIGIVDVVRASGVSRSNLEHRFRVRLRTTINKEITKRRLKRAQALLVDTMLSLEEIARASGFRRVTYFANFFQAQTGMAPGAWRREHRQM